jgi:hypothetical protein
MGWWLLTTASTPANTAITNGVIYYRRVQFEQKSYYTDFTIGTRGSTVATGGGLLDLTNNGNNGEINRTSVPSAAFYSGNNSGSFVFDGSNDYINCGQPSSLLFGTGSFSICQWLYVSTGNILKVTVSRLGNGGGFWLGLDNRYNNNTEGIGFSVNSSGDNGSYHARGTTSDFKYKINQWNNIVAVWDGITKNMLIYLNNTLTTTTQTQNGGGGLAGIGNTDSSTNNIIGAYTNGSSFNFSGKISQTIIYNKVLSANEVQQNYNATKGRYGL